MASRIETDFRRWRTFWSTIQDGVRYRHQVRMNPTTALWIVRTEVLDLNDHRISPYHTAYTIVPTKHGKTMFQMCRAWSNMDENDRPMYPPQYQAGFRDLLNDR
jgi:hypothetical protein